MAIREISDDVKFPDVTVKLIGGDGNAFAILGSCKKAIQRAHGSEAASRWFDAAQRSESYDQLLSFCMETVEVE